MCKTISPPPREAAKKVLPLVVQPLRPYHPRPPSSSLVVIETFCIVFRASKKVFSPLWRNFFCGFAKQIWLDNIYILQRL